MNRYDLLKLEQRIYSLGKTISEQENFYRDVNGFLRGVYPTMSKYSQNQQSAIQLKLQFFKNHFLVSSVDAQTTHTSVPNP